MYFLLLVLVAPYTIASVCVHVKSLQSCLTLCDPMDCSPPGSSVHGIPQARILEWVAIPAPNCFYLCDIPELWEQKFHCYLCKQFMYDQKPEETI